MLTGGIITGMLWSAALGRGFWHNDPKEILAGLTWLLYTVLFVDRTMRLWRGRRAAWIGIMGFALVLCTFLGARYLGGYHVFN
jgi:ABC-type transport system involved in cytochrome c biogenesis permease subunit